MDAIHPLAGGAGHSARFFLNFLCTEMQVLQVSGTTSLECGEKAEA